MTSAYNAAMKESDAKYKIYLHQDLLYEMLGIFQNPQIGMIGIVGSLKLPYHAQVAHAWDCGNVLLYNGNKLIQAKHLDIGEKNVIDVEAVDGMLIMTQYDLLWDQETFDGFHFYDISQCMEFRNHQYRIVLPKSGSVWALHDSGISGEKEYDKYRARFCQKYVSVGFRYEQQDDTTYSKNIEKIERVRYEIYKAAEEDDINAIVDKISEFEGMGYADSDVFALKKYVKFCEKEENKIGWEEFQSAYECIKFFLWRIQFRDESAADTAVLHQICSGGLSLELLENVMRDCVMDQKRVWEKLIEWLEQ
jgi:hypothetical protein